MASILLTFLFLGPPAALVTRLHVDFSARGLVRLGSRRALLPGRRLANRKDRLVHPPSGCGRCCGSCQWVRRRRVLVRGPARRLRRWGRGRPGRRVRRFGGRCCGGHRRVVLAHPRKAYLGGICGPRLGRTVVRPTGWLEHLNRTSYPFRVRGRLPCGRLGGCAGRSDPGQRHHLEVRENPDPKATNSGLRRCRLHALATSVLTLRHRPPLLARLTHSVRPSWLRADFSAQPNSSSRRPAAGQLWSTTWRPRSFRPAEVDTWFFPPGTPRPCTRRTPGARPAFCERWQSFGPPSLFVPSSYGELPKPDE